MIQATPIRVRSNVTRRRKDRRFVPESPATDAPARLEGRLLTNAAFWRYPTGSPQEANDQATAGVAGQTPVTGQFTASASGTDSNAGGTIMGTMTSTIVDNADPDPPAGPVGSYSVSMTSAADIGWTGTQAGVGIAVNAAGNRNYQIASDGSGSLTGWSVYQTFLVNYNAPPSATLNPMFTNFQATLTTPALKIDATGTNTIASVTINGVSEPTDSTGHVTESNGTVITWTWASTALYVTSTTPLGTLPVASSNPVSGIAWPVNYTSTIGMAAFPAQGVTTLQSTMSTDYTGSFKQS